MNNKRILAAALTAATSIGLLAAMPADATSSRTIRYLSTNAQNTDLDLGTPGLSAGDQQVFINDAVRNSKTIGYEAGSCQLVTVGTHRLVASCHETIVLPGGTLTSEFVFEEDPTQGPVGLTLAITGGTGRYRSASGEGTATFIQNTDDLRVVIHLD
jgi:hypothetical protein